MRRRWWLLLIVVALAIVGAAYFLLNYGLCLNCRGLSSESINVTVVSCSGSQVACNLTVANTGTGDVVTNGSCSLTFGGSTHLAVSSSVTIRPGDSAAVTCKASSGSMQSGSEIDGVIYFADGSTRGFSGKAS